MPSIAQKVSNWLLGEFKVRASRVSTGADTSLIQHVRLDVGVGDAESVVSSSIPVSGSVSAPAASTSTLTNVAASASNVTLLPANANRLGATICNDSTSDLYVKFGTTASATSFTVILDGVAGVTKSYFEVPFRYTGRIDGIWVSATGTARITELSA